MAINDPNKPAKPSSINHYQLEADLQKERLSCITAIEHLRKSSGKIIAKFRCDLSIAQKLRAIDCIDEQLQEIGVARK